MHHHHHHRDASVAVGRVHRFTLAIDCCSRVRIPILRIYSLIQRLHGTKKTPKYTDGKSKGKKPNPPYLLLPRKRSPDGATSLLIAAAI